ncbi:unnamed protein product [Toxocara canis]|uniref:PPM-type phosphatase domain-containing protein n=1 Tax=Toxocara canis TaxID=6265 RepID=A0A183U1J2_TOXCA|nr:unnamed protein product [Toxocara canis]
MRKSMAFGDTQLKRDCVLTAHPDVVRVDLAEICLRFILVASDGFWDVVSNDQAVKLANSYIRTVPPNQWHKVAEYLVKTALHLGTEDNVSLLFLRLRS